MSIQRGTELITFHRSLPMSCPYLQGRNEMQLFTELIGIEAQRTYQHLSQAGFRRSHHIAYWPACKGCNACVPVRVVVDGFRVGRTWRRVLSANRDLVVRDVGQTVTDEQFALFKRYVESRHGDGDMANMTRRDYHNMVATSPVDTTLFEFRTAGGELIAVCLADRMTDGYSAVYSYFEPSLPKRSLGSLVILWLIERAAAEGMPFVYLGFWVGESPKMEYKSRFRPIEGFGPTGWRPLNGAHGQLGHNSET